MEVIEWDKMGEVIDEFAPLTLSRNVSEAFGENNFIYQEEEEEFDDVLLKALENDDDVPTPPPGSPASLSYSSDDSSSFPDIASNNSSSSSDYEETKKKTSSTKRSVTKKKNTGLSAQEKREQRKIRNRELAAESRKRKNDEMERLRVENSELKQKLAELIEKYQIPKSQHQTSITQTKRTRMAETVCTVAVASSLAVFVITNPSEGGGLTSTASVLITTLDSFYDRTLLAEQFLFTLFLAAVLLCLLGSFILKFLNRLPLNSEMMNSLNNSSFGMIKNAV